jgi:hypothetical protein
MILQNLINQGLGVVLKIIQLPNSPCLPIRINNESQTKRDHPWA